MTASICDSGTRDDAAEVREHVLREREVLVARVRAGADAGDPSCTVDGAFGIARTTGTPGAMRASIVRRRDRGGDGEHGLLRREQLRRSRRAARRCPAA